MAIPKVNITIVGKKGQESKPIHTCKWDGDLGEWMEDIGSEFAGAIFDNKYDEVIISAEKVK